MGSWHLVVQCGVRTLGVVLDPPSLDGIAGVLQRCKPVLIETLGSQSAIKDLDVWIVCGCPRD